MGLVVRALLVLVGLLVMLGGVALIAIPDIGAAGLIYVFGGGVIIVAVALERQRYRSTAAELSSAAPGPGGGESAGMPLEARFQPTSEVFMDPTTGHRMRVLADPATGERRYVAEA